MTKGAQTTIPADPEYGSDAVAALLRRLGVPFLAINPGASFRGLHDSVVNFLGDREPSLILALHEAQAVAIAHGYAKIAGAPMGVVLHANVGLMNAVMAIYDAYVDRVPMLIIGATGAVDAARRRPWIEWIHTSRDQGALIRPFVKWDDQPASAPAAMESVLRAWLMTQTPPHAPTYVCLPVEVQEDALPAALRGAVVPAPDRFAAASAPVAAPEDVEVALSLIKSCSRPLVLVGRTKRSDQAWANRIALAEALGAAVLCDQKCGVGFPSTHPAYVAAPAQYLDENALRALNEADLILSLDWPDVAGLLSQRSDQGEGVVTIIASPDERLHNGWSFDHFPLPPARLRVAVTPDSFVQSLLRQAQPQRRTLWRSRPHNSADTPTGGPVTLAALAHAFERVRANHPVCITRLPFGWPEALTRFTHPLDCIGYDGGGGIGSTPGITVGAALALKGSGRLPVAILGDGDLLMGSQALWTAAQQSLPALFIVNNNRSFFNDVEHQERVARHRRRPVERREVGMIIDSPPVDIPALARAYGLSSFGPVDRIEDLDAVLTRAFAAALAGETVLLDVKVPPPAVKA